MPRLGHTTLETNIPTGQCPGCAEFMKGHYCLYSGLGLKLSVTMEPLPFWAPNGTVAFQVIIPVSVPDGICYIRSEKVSAKESQTYQGHWPAQFSKAPTCVQPSDTWQVFTAVLNLHRQKPVQWVAWLAIKPFIRRHLCDEIKGQGNLLVCG